MLIKYYKNNDLAYANRKRFITFNYEPFYEEEQRSVLLGDGSQTSIKTSKNNICDYVKIGDTRWFVTSYEYLNGSQVRLNLQRDVIGEFGLVDCFGKVERGYTNGILKHKKELGLNQIRKKRFPIISDTATYGNYMVDNHEKEAWGIIYFVKPSGLNPNTGEPYEDTININIPAFNPTVSNFDFIESGTVFDVSRLSNSYISFNVEVPLREYTGAPCVSSYWNVKITFDVSDSRTNPSYIFGNTWETSSNKVEVTRIVKSGDNIFAKVTFENSLAFSEVEAVNRLKSFALIIADYIRVGELSYTGFVLPDASKLKLSESVPTNDYNNAVLLKDDVFYKYTVIDSISKKRGSYAKGTFINFIADNDNYNGSAFVEIINDYQVNNDACTLSSSFDIRTDKYINRVLTGAEAGILSVDLNVDFVDEPYIVLAVPLFDTKISSVGGNFERIVDDKKAFNVFNSIIEYLSGDNPYIVDAQVYPYAPPLAAVSSEIAGVPIFSLLSTSYQTYCTLQLLPFIDVKKEYIERLYSIVAPDQSAKTSFNFYDYKTNVVTGVDNSINYAGIKMVVKTALKPFSIISSCYPIPDDNAIIGIDYESNLSGCKSSSNGFQASMSSSAFETYRRQNSNYQQIFQLEKDQLVESHKVEKANEIVSAIAGTASVTAMGAITGAAAADIEIRGFNFKGVGGAVGGATAGTIAGSAYAAQLIQNEKLRDFEKRVQQQRFDLEIGTIKNLPLSVNRVSTFNEIILRDFYYVVELYECTEEEKNIVNNFILKYSYSIGVFDFLFNYARNGWFLKANLVTSNLNTNLFNVASNDLLGGIYYYE